MAHKKAPKRNWQSIEIDPEFSFSAGLAPKDLVAFLASELADDNFIATSLTAVYQLRIEQGAEPNSLSNILFGVSKSDYSAAEIEEWVENASGFKRENLIAQEISGRHIKQIGMFAPPALAAAAQVVVEINDGMPIKTRLNWRILEDTTLAFWVYNAGSVSIVATTGQQITVMGKIVGFWED